MTICALFDLDETLIRIKSIFEFMRFYQCQLHQAEGEGERQYQQIVRQLSETDSRANVNEKYFQYYAGESKLKLDAIGESWWRLARKQSSMINADVLRRLQEHQRADHLIIVLTGSVRSCVEPIMHEWNIDHVVCSEQMVSGGFFTGELMSKPNIGEAKAEHVLALLDQLGCDVDWSESYAYGDHESDVPFLSLVGHTCVIEPSASFRPYVLEQQWEVIDH